MIRDFPPPIIKTTRVKQIVDSRIHLFWGSHKTRYSSSIFGYSAIAIAQSQNVSLLTRKEDYVRVDYERKDH